MPISAFTLLTWFAGLAALPGVGPVTVTRLVVHEEVILRVPVVRPRAVRPIVWVEKKGPKCIASGQIVAAALASDQAIDFLLRDRSRVRATMDRDCPTLDFYGSFYIEPSRDERICAKREEIRSRIGGACRIERFRMLRPKLG